MPSSPVDFSKPHDQNAISGQSVLITGGASGIGRGIAEAVAVAGAHVIIVDNNKTEGESLAGKLTEQSYHAHFIHADVTSFESQKAAFKQAVALLPTRSIDHVIACAGLTGNSIVSTLGTDLASASLSSDPPQPNTKVIETNLLGVYYTVHLALYYFAASYNAAKAASTPSSNTSSDRKRHILIVGSLESYGTQPDRADYPAAKWGVRGMWRGIRNSGALVSPPGAPGVRMNFLAPALVETPMTANDMPMYTSFGFRVAAVGDAVAAATRMMCDEEVEGRSVAVGPAVEEGAVGSGCVDLLDEHAGLDGSPRTIEFMRGALGQGALAITGMSGEEMDALIERGKKAIIS